MYPKYAQHPFQCSVSSISFHGWHAAAPGSPRGCSAWPPLPPPLLRVGPGRRGRSGSLGWGGLALGRRRGRRQPPPWRQPRGRMERRIRSQFTMQFCSGGNGRTPQVRAHKERDSPATRRFPRWCAVGWVLQEADVAHHLAGCMSHRENPSLPGFVCLRNLKNP